MKKIVSLILSCIIILGSIPMVSAGAEETNTVMTEGNADAGLNDVSITSTNSLSSLLSNELEESTQNDESDSNAVLDCKMEGNIASIKVANLVACKIIVSIYDEDTNNMVASGMVDIEPQAVNVNVELNKEFLPEFYLVKVFMLDENNKPLSKSYECKDYTQSYQEFLSLTVDDFSDKNVLQLNDDKTNNFGVYEDYVKLITSTNENIYSAEDSTTNVYVFTNINKNISSLQPGDIVSYTYGETQLIFKVKTISVESTNANIEIDGSLEINEVFSYLKIITESTDSMYNSDNCDEGITYLGVSSELNSKKARGLEISKTLGENSLLFEIKMNDNEDDEKQDGSEEDVEVEVGAELSGSLSLEFISNVCMGIYDNGNINYFDVAIDVNCSSNLTFANKFSTKASLGKFTIPVGSSGVIINLKTDLIFESSIEATIIQESKSRIVIKHHELDQKSSVKNYSLSSSIDKKTNLQGNVFLGFEITTEISFINMLSAGIKTKTGFKITGILITEHYEGHDCQTCIDGGVSFIVEPTIVFKFFDIEYSINIDSLTLEKKLFDWYFSDVYGFGFTICPGLATKEEYLNTYKPISCCTYDKGSCGKNVRFVFDKGVLTITGQGEMYSYCSQNLWKEYKNDIVKVNIGEGITSLGRETFHSFQELTTVNLPSTLKNISYAAFYNCEELEKIDIPYGVTNIDSDAFSGCKSIRSIDIPDSVESIGASAFSGCSILQSITIPDSVRSIGSSTSCSVFANCSLLKEVYLPDEVDLFNMRDAFLSCKSLKTVTLPKGIKKIGYGAFSSCQSLTNLTIPEGVTEISSTAFMFCSSLTRLVIPNSVKTIDEFAFYGAFPNPDKERSEIHFQGTEQEWASITFGSYNGNLYRPAILFDNESTEETITVSSLNLKSINYLNANTTDNNNSEETKDIVRTGLVPNTLCYLMILKGTEDNYTIDSSSLLYISDTVADENGTVEFDVFYEDTNDNVVSVIFGYCDHNFGEVEVITQPTQATQGLQGQVCSKCSAVINGEAIAKLPSIVYLDDVNVFSGTEYTLPNSNEKGFVAYTDGQSYFVEGETIELVGDINLTTLSIGTVSMLKGASIRLNEVQGMRFYTKVNIQKINELKDLGFEIQLGTLIAPYDLLEGNELTFDLSSENFVDVQYNASEFYSDENFEGVVGSLVNIKDHNINRNFIGRGYIKISFNETEKIIYADYAENNINNNTRSISCIAYFYKNDSTSNYDSLGSDFKESVDKWASLYSE